MENSPGGKSQFRQQAGLQGTESLGEGVSPAVFSIPESPAGHTAIYVIVLQNYFSCFWRFLARTAARSLFSASFAAN